MLNFTAIDFETANQHRGSPCSVGLARVRDGAVVDTQHWLIQPPESVNWFAPFNTALHGITASRVAHAPRWRDLLPELVRYVGDDVVVAHNAGFDLGVVRYACVADQIEWPTLAFACTLVLSRLRLDLPTYRLPYVAAELGVQLDRHHDALGDAMATAEVLVALARMANVSTVAGLLDSYGVRTGFMTSGTYSASARRSKSRVLTIGGSKGNADPDGDLYGRVVVFTGALASMTRQQAWDEVARCGGIAELNTTRRTNVLVLGDLNPASLVPGATLSGRALKAEKLRRAGQQIELMTEVDFLRALDGT